MIRPIKSLLLTAAIASFTGQDVAASNILFVLDSSNSMWGQVDGTAKADTAKAALGDLVADLPSDTRIGLMVYGHSDKSSCQDVELVLPIAEASAGSVRGALDGIRPTGKTPIAFALEQTALAFKNTADSDDNSVVLVSDGIETCDGDPCAVAESLAAANINVRVHVVGFDISAEDRVALECIAEKGKGRYFAADSTEGFKDAVTNAVQVAQAQSVPEAEAEPEPSPAAEVVFEDEFDGVDLSDHWTVNNAEPDAYIVEDGSLLMIGQAKGQLQTKDHPNVLTLNYDLPAGDWTLTAKLTAELQTGKEEFNLGLFGGEGEAIYARFGTQTGSCCIGSNKFSVAWLSVEKFAKGQRTHFKTEITPRMKGKFSDYTATLDQPITVQLVRNGRAYQARINLAGNVDDSGAPQWTETDFVNSLRAPETVGFTVGQYDKVSGETVWMIDSVKIEKN